jgi:hypothetical protein
MATNIGFLGAAQFDDTWVSIWNSFSAHRAEDDSLPLPGPVAAGARQHRVRPLTDNC